MKALNFAKRNAKEILRDKLTVIFGLGFPMIILLLLTMIQANVPIELFKLNKLTPGVTVFGLSFISLFSGMIISKDRCGSLILRLFTSPMRAADFIIGYTLPLVPISLLQVLFCFALALILGLRFTVHIFTCMLVTLPAIIIFISIGLICGTLFNDKQVGGFCGALLTNLTAWLSGVWFDVSLVGSAFEKAANALPFIHAVNAGRYALNAQFDKILPELIWVCAYAVVLFVIAVILFTKKMHSDKI